MKNVPWPIKIGSKLVLSRLPIAYRMWADIGVFKHGRMASFAYPQRVFGHHVNVGREHGFVPTQTRIMEMGPGDAVSTALLASKAGAAATVLIDAGDFATKDMSYYRALAQELGLLLPPDLSFEQMLARLDCTRLTEGLGAWRSVTDNSVDFVFSHAVLEHVRRVEFAPTMAEMYRVLKPGALASHNIDLKDHVGGRLNNLRFSPELWEQDWFAARSGFYTNRLRPSELLALFADAGFEIVNSIIAKFDGQPTATSAMHSSFQAMSQSDLRASGLHVVLRKPPMEGAETSNTQ